MTHLISASARLTRPTSSRSPRTYSRSPIFCNSSFQASHDQKSTPHVIALNGGPVVIGDTSPFCHWIIDSFPTNASSFATSLASKILDTTSLCFLFLDYPFPDEIKHALSEHRRSVEFGIPVIRAIVPLLDPKSGIFGHDTSEATPTPPNAKKGRETQRSAKRAKHLKYLDDDTPFHNYGIPSPTCREKALKLVADLLAKQRAALEVLTVLL